MTTVSALPDAASCTPNAGYAIGIDAARSMASALKALSEPIRLRMLSYIATDPRGESCVCDLVELTELSQPTVSHHLRVMKDAGLLDSERRGTWVWYRLVPSSRDAVRTVLESFAPATYAATVEHEVNQAEVLRTMDEEVGRLAETLADEFTDVHRALVRVVVRESYASLVSPAKPAQHMIATTERFARQRLLDISRDRESSVPQVLFVCIANAGRSQLAAALVNEFSGGTVVARSAGSQPAVGVHPHVRTLLSKIQGDRVASLAFPKPITDDAVRAADIVITMGCGDVCPIIPGVRYEDWPVGDPALASEIGVALIRDDIAARVQKLIEMLQCSGVPKND